MPVSDLLNNRKVMKYYNLYNSFLKKSPEEINDYRVMKLRDLLQHSYQNVPYYTKLFNEINFQWETFRYLDDLKKIPPLKRSDIQDNYEDLIDKSTKYKHVSKGSSSGSTGKTVSFLHDEEGGSAGFAAHYFGWSLGGFRFGDKGVHIWGNPAIVKQDWNKFSSKMKSKLTRHYKYPAYKLTEGSKYDELIDLINKEKFEFIDGYTNAIYLLAKYVEEHNKQIRKVKFVLTTAENLHDFQKETIERVFGKCFDEYACGEIMGIAYQNKFTSGYATIDPHVVVEFDKNAIGEDGSAPLIITDLDNRVMPMIRYLNGDLAVQDTPNYSELPFGKLKSVSGRISDMIILPGGGSLVVPSFFGGVLLKQIKSIKQYQIVKESENLLAIKFVVEGNTLADSDKIIIQKAMNDYLMNKIDYRIDVVDKIEVGKNGKFKLLVDNTIITK